jgi:hypothetical protein
MHKFLLLTAFLFQTSLNAGEDYFREIYKAQDTTVVMLFSAHTTSSQDNELKRLWRILEGEVTERQKRHLKKQVETKLKREAEALKLEKELFKIIVKEHSLQPFNAVLAEFSEEKRDRYLLRIEVASFVRSRLHELVDTTHENVDDYMLLLTGEDIYPLLEGNILAGLPLIATEKHELQRDVGSKIAACQGMMGVLSLGQSEEAQYASVLFEKFYRPHPNDYKEYLETKNEARELFLNNGLLRLRVGISSKEAVEKAINNCDALFDTRRDEYTASVMKDLPAGRFLLTRGIAHRHLLVNLPELR